ncbi:MAG: two-component regulator propeller domain-containing protein [Terracidiphilus sp.]|jgi:signal transduction histidine kinase/ligand-binding sensor domain-containing protein
MALAAALLLGWALPIHSLEPSTPLANYGRQTWVMENGLPQNTVQALVQTRDGFVWLGTEVGLVRFDGNGFEVFDRNSSPALPGNDVRCLLETKDGALWIGTSEGLARWKDGAVTAFTTKDGLPGNGIRALVESRIGYLLVWTDFGLARLNDDGRFIDVTSRIRLPASSITAVTTDGQGGVSVMTRESVARYEGEGSRSPVLQQQLEPVFPKDGAEFIQEITGEVVVATKGMAQVLHGDTVVARLAAGKELPGSRIQALLLDRERCLWIGTNGGLARWVDGKLERLPVTDPLATASVLALMEDREGNLWVGTETSGLHILRDQRFRTMGAREGLSSDAMTTVVEDSAGTLWVGTGGAGLNAVGKNGRVKNYTVKDGLLSDVILSLAAAPNGDLWVGTPDGLNRIRGGKIDAFTSADGLPDDFIRSLLADGDGSLWIGTRRGLTHWTNPGSGISGEHMETFTQASGLGSDLVGSMVRDASGDLWVATLAGLSRLHAGRISNYMTADGLSSNVITALLSRANGTLLIGTQDHGWNLWDGRRFSKVVDGGLDQTSIHAILDDGGGHLWFATGNGIARCDCNGMGSKMSEAGTAAGCSHWMEFGAADGLRSRDTATNSHPSAWRSRDGRLWFATPKGLVEVDPAHFPVNSVPPPVALERFAVDDAALRAAGSLVVVQAGHVHFEFDYAGLSFTAPQKVRYRYMLEGFDRGWTEAGTRRAAYYTTIPPGKYTFRVQAANNDGVWNTEGAALTFELRPHFYQTVWFYALMVALAAGMVVVLLRLRLRRAEGEFRAVLGERSRIAREIHDTLAQGYVGISVQLEVLAELLRHHKTEEAAKRLDQTRGYVRQGLSDARQSIWALRSQDSGETTLPVRLRRMAEAEGGSGLESSCNIFGAYRPLPPGTEREILLVAQEAIHNVKKHAGAKHLFVQLEYGPGEIALEVRDDGQGFAAGEQQAPGHFGLTGMRERAAAIGGRLEVTSDPGGGTTVRLEAPAARETGSG